MHSNIFHWPFVPKRMLNVTCKSASLCADLVVEGIQAERIAKGEKNSPAGTGLSIRMHLRCPRSQSLTVQGRASLVLLVFYHASTSYCGVTFTQLLEFLCPLIRNSRALVRCNSINCYNVSSLPWACKMALVRCNSISCYNTHPRKSPLSRGFTVIEF